MTETTPEHARVGDKEWMHWGPYVSERAWGTVREDYSPDGSAWDSFPHDHARSRAYRWNEDGLGGICEVDQRLCLAFAFWNGNDPFLKERIFGLSNDQGNHGEDAKECWWYADSTPSHSFMRWQYAYPHAAFPYQELVDENARRGRIDAEYELLDTNVFEGDRYFDIEIVYAKAHPDDWAIQVHVRNAGPEAATIHVLPTLWFRNIWSWGDPVHMPHIALDGPALVAHYGNERSMTLVGGSDAIPLFCDNETNTERLWGTPGPAYPKDGINDHVVDGRATVNPAHQGTKAALHHVVTIDAGATHTITLRFASGARPGTIPGCADVIAARRGEGDEFYAALTPAGASADEAAVLRQAFAGMMWGKQFYHYDVDRWLDGDPTGSPPPDQRLHGRNSQWRHLNNYDVISMPDPWEYPWYAAWDLAFHCIAIAHVDPGFAKDQLLLMCREWYMHPNGQLPAYEWALSDVNPPVHAMAALQVYNIEAQANGGNGDLGFLERVFHKLLLNFTWWVNRKDAEGNNIFEGGFLGLDNIGPIDRSSLPVNGYLEQADGTAWMAMFCLDMLEISLVLAAQDPIYEDLATKFFEHFVLIGAAVSTAGLWDDEDGFYYDLLKQDGQRTIPLRVRSMVGLLPLAATTTIGHDTMNKLPAFAERFQWFLTNKSHLSSIVTETHVRDGFEGRLLAVVGSDRLLRLLAYMLDEQEFLSPYGLRAVSKYHYEHPFHIELAGADSSVGYDPGESTSGLFGGNSNWRGPVWFPVNHVIIGALRRYGRFFGDDFLVEYPTGSGQQRTLDQVADDLSHRLVSIFLDDANHQRPVFGTDARSQIDPIWHGRLLFNEYFHGDSGRGLGASHQTGWTGLVADLILRRHGAELSAPPEGSGSHDVQGE